MTIRFFWVAFLYILLSSWPLLLRAEERLIVRVSTPRAATTDAIALRVRIAQTQARVSDSCQMLGCKTTTRYKYIPYMAMTCPAGQRSAVSNVVGVESVHEDPVATIHPPLATPQLTDSIPLVGAAALHARGITGLGQNIAVFDTGVESGHQGLRGRVVRQACFANNGDCPNGTAKMIGPGAGEPCLFSTACFHGTHVSGIVAADDATVVGMAPKAGVIAVRVFTNNNGNASAFFSDIVQAYEFVIDLVAEGIPVRAVNMSLGTGPMDFPCDSSFPALKDIVDVALANGIASAVSSGNGSNTTGLSAPSCLSNTLSIGCTSKSDSICAFSNSAPGLDMLSPGLSINSLTLNGQYRVASGTSMSAPHVAGAFALLYHGSAPGSIQQAQNALKLSGPSITDTRNNVTVNRFNVEQALATLPDPSTCGDGVREGPEECDGADDPLCEGRCLADCTCDRTGCFPCEECEDCPTPPRCDSCCPDAPECPGCSSCCPDCPVPPCPPFCTDSDNDGHANDNDRCPFTEEGLEVDELGCSQAEFCERIKINVRRDARVCKKADWHNDQPLANKTYDCHFDNNGTWFNRRDDECVKGDR